MLQIIALSSCSGIGNRPAAPEPAKPIDMARFYDGRWYEIGRTPMTLTDGCVAGTTDYYRDGDNRLIERDACRADTPQGEEKVIQGPVTLLNPDTGTKFSVRYQLWGFLPIWRTYWVLDHGEAYDWFIYADPALENVNLFTRSHTPSPAMVEMLKRRTRELGYDPSKLEFPEPFPP
jgi:apolipoprotein D and lipocalin family protein